MKGITTNLKGLKIFTFSGLKIFIINRQPSLKYFVSKYNGKLIS